MKNGQFNRLPMESSFLEAAMSRCQFLQYATAIDPMQIENIKVSGTWLAGTRKYSA